MICSGYFVGRMDLTFVHRMPHEIRLDSVLRTLMVPNELCESRLWVTEGNEAESHQKRADLICQTPQSAPLLMASCVCCLCCLPANLTAQTEGNGSFFLAKSWFRVWVETL